MMPICESAELASVCAAFRSERYITIDTEFMRDRTYWPKLCLVQLAGKDQAVAVDTLAPGLDLQPLIDLLLDQAVLKVFHACRQDLEIFYRLMGGRLPAPIFDTQVAAMVCGFGEEVAYDTLVSKVARAKVDKSSRFTDWSKRPLSQNQLRYALGDVTHLRVIFEKLAERIEKAGRDSWVEEELQGLLDPALYELKPEEAWRRLKFRSREPRFVAIAQALAAWRERKAQARDLPRNRILRDDLLLEVAANRPTSSEHLRKLERVNLDRDSVREVAETISAVLELDESDLPELPPARQPARGIGPIIDLLRVLLKQCSEESDVAQRLIANTADLEIIAQDDDPDVAALRGWRRQIFGEKALALRNGTVALAIADRKVRLVDIEP